MKLVYICSPLRGDLKGNMEKATAYCKAASKLGVIPLAPHTIFTQYLNDNIPSQRKQALSMGLSLLRRCDELWVCGNIISSGMRNEIKLASETGIPIKYMKEVFGMDELSESEVFRKLETMEQETGARAFVFYGNSEDPPIINFPAEVEDYLTQEEMELAEKLFSQKKNAELPDYRMDSSQQEEVSDMDDEEVQEYEEEFEPEMCM